MPNIKRIFISGRMDKDLDERLLPDGVYSDALNVDVGHTEGDNSGIVKNVMGNTKIGDLGNVSGRTVNDNTSTIGYVAVEAENKIFWLVASDYFDGIYEYNEITGTVSRILQSNRTPVTTSKLNFSQSYRVTGINYANGFLFWTERLNGPRRINVSRARSYNIDDDRIDMDISVILAPPLNPPIIDMLQETEQENNMEERFLRFATRWKYMDNQYSAFSPFSGVAFVPDDYFLDYGAGENKSMLNQKNRVKISFETGSQFVTEIDLLLIDTKSLNVFVVESFNKEELDLSDNFIHSFTFANSKKYRSLPGAQLGRMYDNVPLLAGSQEIIGRRLIYGDYDQNYDITDSNGKEIKIDFDVSFVNRWHVSGGQPLQTFRSDRDYEVAIQYGDDYGRFSTPLTSENNNIYIPPEFSVTSNSLTVEINNRPPAFASWYRLMIKQARKAYYSVFPILYYASGMYRYFLINSFDRDKVREGEYVIFKSDNSGPTQDNKKYKVLEVAAKGENFLSQGSTNEIPGLYFKIKVKESYEFNPSDIFTHSFEGVGSNEIIDDSFSKANYLTFMRMVDNPIHYGDGPSNIISVTDNFTLSSGTDVRFTIKILSQTEMAYTSAVSASSGWITIPITTGAPITLYHNGVAAINITIQSQSYYYVDDRWKINCRNDGHFTGNIFGGIGVPDSSNTSVDYGDWGGAAILPGPGWGLETDETAPTAPTDEDREIKAGAVVRIEVIQDKYNPTQQAGVQQFPPSPRDYKNIEEWFIESGAYLDFKMYDQNGNNVGATAVTFRRGRYFIGAGACFGPQVGVLSIPGATSSNYEFLNMPVRMIIQGYGTKGDYSLECNGPIPNYIRAKIDIQQTDNLSICETRPQESDTDIYHEVSRTYPIENGLHKVMWSYLDFTFPSWVTIDGTQYTNLGQLDPEGDPENTDGIQPHYFQVGDLVDVRTTGGAGNTTYTVLAVPNKYNIVINQASLGAGPVTPGRVGFHHDQYIEADQVGTMPARILINASNNYNIYQTNGSLLSVLTSAPNPGNTNSMYNAYTFGNGLESDRIRDDFNSTTIEYSPRASTPVEDYKRERRKSSLTYSGIFSQNNAVNAFNEFNLSIGNYKDLDISFGSIQKLFSRDTNLLVFQENKVGYVLYEKNLLSDSTGGGSITSIPEVLGSHIAFPGEWGISSNPESFAFWGGKIWFADARRGAILMMSASDQGYQIIPISSIGMSDFFKDLLSDIPNTEKIGGYDPRRDQYVISSNENPSIACEFSLSISGKSYPATIGGAAVESDKPDFYVYSNTSWTAEIVYSAGSGWVTGYPVSGFGNQAVYLSVADNGSGTVRTATITFTYCDGLTATFVVTQGKKKGKVIVIVVPPTAPLLNE